MYKILWYPYRIHFICSNISHNNISTRFIIPHSSILYGSPLDKKTVRSINTSTKGRLIWVYDITKLSINEGLVIGAPFKTIFSPSRVRRYSTNTHLYEPIKKYENADIQKLQILEENKGKIGVYLLRNLNNKKFYIGSSSDLRRRFKEYYNVNHLLRNKNLAICAALIKYGYSQFSLEIIEYCDLSVLFKREQYYLDLLKPEYNILKIAGSFVGFKHSQETKNKLSIIFKGTNNAKNQPTAIPVQVIDLETGKITQYTSARKAAEALNMSNSTVIRKLADKKPYKKRYIFKVCDE